MNTISVHIVDAPCVTDYLNNKKMSYLSQITVYMYSSRKKEEVHDFADFSNTFNRSTVKLQGVYKLPTERGHIKVQCTTR